jgi:hypothetical protein
VAVQAVANATGAGRKVSPQVAADVEETLRSAMVDPNAGAALASGRLTDNFSSNGLEPVDLSRVVALADRVTGPCLAGCLSGRDGRATGPCRTPRRRPLLPVSVADAAAGSPPG